MHDLNKPLKLNKQKVPAAKKQAGISLVPVIIGIAVFSLSTVLFLNQGGGLFQSARMDAATTEITKLIQGSLLFRQSNGGYAAVAATGAVAISIANLAGYGIAPIVTGTGDNVYGLNSTVGPTAAATTATLTYAFDTANACGQAAIRFRTMDGVSATTRPACSTAGVLTVIIN